MRLAAVLIALPLSAQSFLISAGTPSDPGMGGYAYTSVALKAQPYPFNNMRAGTAFSYTLIVPNGTYSLTLDLIENRPAGPDPATQSGIGTRIFTVTVQGFTGPPIDIFAAVGALMPYQLTLPPVQVTNGKMQVTFTAIKGNAVLCGLIGTPPLPPFMLSSDGWHFAGDLHIEGNLIVSGSEQTGTPGTPSVFTITQQNGSTCAMTFSGGNISLKC